MLALKLFFFANRILVRIEKTRINIKNYIFVVELKQKVEYYTIYNYKIINYVYIINKINNNNNS